MMTKTMHGVIRGKTIELESDPGMSDGQQVEVTVRVAVNSGKQTWGEGLARCAGALAASWTPEDDRILDEIHRERETESRLQIGD